MRTSTLADVVRTTWPNRNGDFSRASSGTASTRAIFMLERPRRSCQIDIGVEAGPLLDVLHHCGARRVGGAFFDRTRDLRQCSGDGAGIAGMSLAQRRHLPEAGLVETE